jgi:hypothetical protein
MAVLAREVSMPLALLALSLRRADGDETAVGAAAKVPHGGPWSDRGPTFRCRKIVDLPAEVAPRLRPRDCADWRRGRSSSASRDAHQASNRHELGRWRRTLGEPW